MIYFQLRSGTFDVLVGVNLLREGLDLPEVSLVIILDADKEGFLRSRKSLIQTIGRAARNINGKAIMYADKITKSMQETIDLTKKRRAKQELYNLQNKITPKQIIKNVKDTFEKEKITENKSIIKIDDNSKVDLNITKAEKEKLIREIRKQMEDAAKELNFLEAARLRDLIDIYKKSG